MCVFFCFLPNTVSVVCPTGPNPPLRLARRPNRGHIGGLCVVCVPELVFIPVKLLAKDNRKHEPHSREGRMRHMYIRGCAFPCDGTAVCTEVEIIL